MKPGDIPEGYVECIQIMHATACLWAKQHPFAEPFQFINFERELKRERGIPEDTEVLIPELLSTVIDRWAGNEDTRAFLRALVEATDNQATYTQTKILFQATLADFLKRGSGKLPGSDWICVGCGLHQKSFTNMDGEAIPPEPGSLIVCASCGKIQCVNDAGTNYTELSTREFNSLPKDIRKRLRAMQVDVEKVNAEAKRKGESEN